VSDLTIRPATSEDWLMIWPFVRDIVAAGETYTYRRDLDEAEARSLWMLDRPGETFVATDPAGTVLGSAKLYPNFSGASSHIASASFMVDPTAGGRGVGRALGVFVLERARQAGYRAMQFNAVVETNAGAVALWRSLGFQVLATLPEAFDHPAHGYVGMHIMFRRL
jgi:L-amino acid N-acyltransferase YncA